MQLKSIQSRIVLWAGLCLVLMGGALVTFAAVALHQKTLQGAKDHATTVAVANAGRIKTAVEVPLDAARTLAQTLQAAKTDPEINLTRAQVDAMLRRVLVNNPDFLGVYTLWEPNAFDGKDADYANTPGHDETGRYIPYWVRDENGNFHVEPLADYEVEGIGDWYLLPRQTKAESILDPFLYPIDGQDVLMTSLVVPVVVDDQFYGIAGVDIRADFLQELADSVDLGAKDATLYLISNNGTLAGVSGQPELVGQHIEAVDDDWEDDLALLQAGDYFSQSEPEQFEFYAPIQFGHTTTPWSVTINIPTASVMGEANQLMLQMVGVGILLLLAALALLWFLAGRLAKPIKFMTNMATNIGDKGDLNRHISADEKKRLVAQGGEIGQLAGALLGIEAFLQNLTRMATSVADGDLRVTAKPLSDQDEFGIAFQQMIVKLRQLVKQVIDSADHVNTTADHLTTTVIQTEQATHQIADTIQQIAAGVTQQSSKMSHTANSMNQMSRAIEGVAQGAHEQAAAVGRSSEIAAQIFDAIQQVAANAQNGSKEAAMAAQSAHNGTQTVEATIVGMDTIKKKVGLSAQKMQDMGNRSDQIGAIIETIDDIASQTNLLALNAAIEAARAGEHGKGFAVVADEVRKLAEKSATATKEIATLIKGIQQTINDAIQAMDEGAREVEAGVSRANNAGKALNSIMDAAEAVSQQVEAIAAAAQQMNASSQEMVSAIDTVSAVVEENTASTAQMATNSAEVAEAIDSIASVSQENSAAIEEVNAGAEEMNAQVAEVAISTRELRSLAQALHALVNQFRLDDSGVGPAETTGTHITLKKTTEILPMAHAYPN